MREFGSSSISLAGSLLIAHPSLLDPNFRKGVIFLSAHDAEEGSFGIMLNRPAGRTVSEVLPGKELGPLGAVPLCLGGPVATDQLIFADFRWNADEKRFDCRHHLGLEEAQESAEIDPHGIRAFVGYAGWSKGQLEAELAQHAWLVKRPERDLLNPQRSPTLWRDVLKSFGPWFQLVGEAPENPSLN